MSNYKISDKQKLNIIAERQNENQKNRKKKTLTEGLSTQHSIMPLAPFIELNRQS